MPQYIDRKSLIIPRERQRQEFDAQHLEDLRQSIETTGLLHAPVIRIGEDGSRVLVAGESRIKAIDDLWALGGTLRFNGESVAEGMLPYTTLGQLTRIQAEEAELDENLRRKSLTWQEHAAAVSRLARLRQEQAASQPVPVSTAEVVKQVAHEVYSGDSSKDSDYATDLTRKEILVASHLGNPAIAKAKSADEAFKILKREEARTANIELARIVGKTFNADEHQAINANCLTWMENADANQFDVILTDPPYGMGADDFGDSGGRLAGAAHGYDDSLESWRLLISPWCRHAFRVSKPEAHAYVFCDIDNFHELKLMMEGAGWYVTRTPFIIHKQNSGRVPHPDIGPRRQWEMLLYAVKGKKPTTHIYPDVVSAPADENLSHGAQKPVAVYQNLLQRSIKPGDRVLDSFAGTGTIFPAAHGFKVSAVGIEQSPASYGLCIKRLEELKRLETAGAVLI